MDKRPLERSARNPATDAPTKATRMIADMTRFRFQRALLMGAW